MSSFSGDGRPLRSWLSAVPEITHSAGKTMTRVEDGKVGDLITRLYGRFKESSKGQDMIEYALIVTSVALVVWLGYQKFGNDVLSYATQIGGDL